MVTKRPGNALTFDYRGLRENLGMVIWSTSGMVSGQWGLTDTAIHWTLVVSPQGTGLGADVVMECIWEQLQVLSVGELRKKIDIDV